MGPGVLRENLSAQLQVMTRCHTMCTKYSHDNEEGIEKNCKVETSVPVDEPSRLVGCVREDRRPGVAADLEQRVLHASARVLDRQHVQRGERTARGGQPGR